ncbi:hypothetical protein [Sphingomonas sp. ACRSK]|uniref:hypothetical protein n=1 Tax=Sphingomonas sp. ACRSK TaxID=2918213 RepID=UPI001EF576D4|nr:hypothetical protein [Sphingomonas sp. ACRSK]MCG7348901.1 hypothetical protein [Sphingomonas sp. ACRSK]
MIDTDTRQLRRRADGTYTSGGTNTAGERKIPCDHCGVNRKCELQPRTACNLFVPTLPFQDETGLHDVANTVRVGVAWTQRLLTNQVVALYNVKLKHVFGLALVVSTEAGPIDEILERHAHRNHLMLTTPPHTAAIILKDWQLRNYGPRIINEKTRATAIYLQRLGLEDAAAYLQGHEARRIAQGCASRTGQDHGDGERHPLHPDRAEGPGHLAGQVQVAVGGD